MKWQKAFAFIIAAFIYLDCSSQSSSPDQSLIKKSFTSGPNTASLSRFNNYPVSYYTGLPGITIPLYTIEVGDISVPISLDYHAAGNRVTDVPGWAGIGWSLSCGGRISRSIVGAGADESSNGYLRNPLKLILNPDVDDDLLYINRVATSEIDAEPDIFSWNTSKHSGKFFFNHKNNYKPAVIPYSPVEINKYFDAGTGKLWFEIIDNDGTRNIFGDQVREVTSGNNGGVNFSNTSAWLLEKMISSDERDTIAFSYTIQSSIPLEDVVESWGVDDNRDIIVNDVGIGSPGVNQYAPNSQAFLTSSAYSSISTEYIPKEIFFKNGKVIFVPSTLGRQDFRVGFHSARSLKAIQIYNLNPTTGAYDLLQSYVLFHGYFMQGADSLTRRLRLDSVQVLDKNNVVQHTYRMQYNSEALPERNSKARDYWGFYNGKANSSLIPRMDILYTTGIMGTGTNITIGSDIANGREPDSVKMQAGILKRLYLPTGGYTDFEYETNRYLENNTTKLAGGLRVKSIKTFDPVTNRRLTRFYKYGVNENGAGKKNFALQDFHFVTSQTHRYWWMYNSGPTVMVTKTRRTITANPSIDILPWDESIVIYPEVTEYIDSTGASGKIVYQFTDITDATLSASLIKPVKSSYVYKRGQLLNKMVYNKVGSQYKLKESDRYYYQAFSDTLFDQAGFVARRLNVNEGAIDGGVILPSSFVRPSDAGSFLYSFYTINSGDNLCTGKAHRVYDDGDPTRFYQSVEFTSYDNLRHMEPSLTYKTSSEADTLFTLFKYPADYLSGNSTGSAVMDSMVNRNIQGQVIESIKYKIDKGTSAKKYLSGAITTFRLANGGKDIVQDASKILAIDRPITDFIQSSVSAGVLQTDSRYINQEAFNIYNTGGKLAQYAARTMAPGVQLWDYNNDCVVAIVKNATLGEVAYSSFETSTKNNFSYTGSSTVDATAPAGKKVYNLGQAGGAITFPALTDSNTYRISYWTKNIVPYTIAGTAAGYPLKGLSYNGWNYYEHKVSGITSLTLSGTGMIDELRLCPFNARMVTCTVLPLVGITGTADEAGNLKFYEYDAANRFKVEREFKNILRTIDYRYKQ